MYLMIKQMELVLKSIEFTNTTAEEKDTAISLMSDIVAKCYREYKIENKGLK